MKKLATVLGVLFAVVVVLAAGVVMVGAQETTNDSSPPAGSIATGFGRGLGQELVDPEAIHAAIAGALGISVDELAAARAEGKSLATLADELGVDLADVQAAVQAVVEEAVTQAVADGTITQAQADQILARLAEDGLGALRSLRGAWQHLMAGIVDRDAVQAAVADALGISVDELAAAHAEGTTLATLADEQGVDLADVQAAAQAVVEEAVTQAVADGTITQAQADQILARLAEDGLGALRSLRGAWQHLMAGIVDRDAVQAAVADALGISVDELAAAHAEGTTLATLADEQGVSLDDVQAAVQAVIEEAVAQAVADGTITQAQADQILARLAEWPGFGLGGPRGGGFNPAGFNNNGASDA